MGSTAKHLSEEGKGSLNQPVLCVYRGNFYLLQKIIFLGNDDKLEFWERILYDRNDFLVRGVLYFDVIYSNDAVS